VDATELGDKTMSNDDHDDDDDERQPLDAMEWRMNMWGLANNHPDMFKESEQEKRARLRPDEPAKRLYDPLLPHQPNTITLKEWREQNNEQRH